MARIFEVLLPALMVATALGAFGNGVIARTHAGQPGSALWIEYDRIVRFGAPVRLVVHARPSTDGIIELRLEATMVRQFDIQGITPEPTSATLAHEGLTYRFDAGPDASAPVIFELQPIRRWRLHGHIRSPSGAVQFAQFVLP